MASHSATTASISIDTSAIERSMAQFEERLRDIVRASVFSGEEVARAFNALARAGADSADAMAVFERSLRVGLDPSTVAAAADRAWPRATGTLRRSFPNEPTHGLASVAPRRKRAPKPRPAEPRGPRAIVLRDRPWGEE